MFSYVVLVFICFFFFKQKSAYEMRIGDWSSDVCSSDLRTAPRIRGWMGRADQTTKVKGMFVHPAQVAAVLKRHGEIRRARLVVTRQGDSDIMTLQCEVADSGAGLSAAIADSLQSACKLKGAVELLALGTLPNDGKVLADQRGTEGGGSGR